MKTYDGMHIVEGINGLWHYHIAEQGTNAKALCGAETMSTEIHIEDWGVPFGEHFPKRPTWCEECARATGKKRSAGRSDNAMSK